jgi:hypothetical protein
MSTYTIYNVPADNSDIIWVALGYTHIAYSLDADAATWTSYSTGGSDPRLDLSYGRDASGGGLWIGGSFSGAEIFKSSSPEDQNSWTTIDLPGSGDINSVDYRGTTWMLGGEFSVWRSVDGGTNWTDVLTGLGSVTGMAGDGNGSWLAINYNGNVHKSLDNGETWELNVYNVGDRAKNAAYGDGVWMAINSEVGPRNISRSTDITDNSSWTTTTISGTDTADIVYLGNKKWAVVGGVADNEISFSADNGLTWVNKTGPGGAPYSIDAYNGVWVVTGRAGQIHRSLNEGDTWELVGNIGSESRNVRFSSIRPLA